MEQTARNIQAVILLPKMSPTNPDPLRVIPKLGSSHTFTLPDNEVECSCITKNDENCCNTHKFLYVFFTENKLVRCCGIKAHKKKIYNTMIKGKDVKYNLYKIERFNYHIAPEDSISSVYSCIGVNVDDKFHYNNPLVQLSKSVNEIKTNLNDKIDENNKTISTLKDDIVSLRTAISTMSCEIYRRRMESAELEKAIDFTNHNTVYKPSNIKCKEKEESCSICCNIMEPKDASHLYECSHVFHNECIKKWFKGKNKLTCPMCRADCNVDNYFTLDTR